MFVFKPNSLKLELNNLPIQKIVKKAVGNDCGCDERRELLNKKFPYKKG